MSAVKRGLDVEGNESVKEMGEGRKRLNLGE